MKKLLFLFSASLCICLSSCKDEKLAIAGSGWNDIAIINKKNGVIEWKHTLNPGEECNDIEVTPEGNILYAYSKGAKLINRNRETIWDYKAGENERIHSASYLQNGGYMVAVCGEPARIVEFDMTGKQTNEISFETLIFDINYQFRQVTKTKDGTYLVPLIGKQKILQLSTDGRLEGNIYVGNDLFSVKELDNNNILVSCGRNGRFIEINPAYTRRDSFQITNQVQGAVLRYVAEIVLQKNGNKLIVNSNMYSSDKSQPLMIEIDSKNNVVWSLPYNKKIHNITAAYSFVE